MSTARSHEFRRARGVLECTLVGCFAAALAAPSVDEWVRPAEERGPRHTELREPARVPRLPFDAAALRSFPRAFEAWYCDHLGLRDRMLRSKSAIALYVFGVSSTPVVDLGRDGWMFFTGDRSRDVHRGRLALSAAELDAWSELLAERARLAEEQGFEHLFVLGPNKETIYPERVPRSWARAGPTRLEQFFACLEPNDARKTRVLDLREALRAERAHDVEADDATPGDHVHHEYGTHWNGRGDAAAYRAIVEALGERRTGLVPAAREALVRKDRGHHGDTWGRAMYLDDRLPQRSYAFVSQPVEHTKSTELGVKVWIATGPDPDAPRAVFFHDSFGESLRELLAPHFSRLVCHWRAGIDEAVVAREAPDVVIELYVERLLATHRAEDLALGGADAALRAFQTAATLGFELTRENAAAALLPREGARVEIEREDALARIVLVAPASHVVVAPLALDEPGDLLVRLEIESPVATEAVLLPIWSGESSPRRRQSAAARLAPGWNRIHLRVPRSPRLEGIALRPGLVAGGYRLRTLEVRVEGSAGAGTTPAARKE